MDIKKLYLLISFVLLVGLLPQGNVSADIGPKPSFQFQFIQNAHDSNLVLGTWTLISCPDSECKNLDGILKIAGDNFTCEDNACHAILNPLQYQGNSYFQIEASFSDNKSRRSNIFEKTYFDAKFRVTIQNDSLFVEELKGSNPSLLSNPLSVILLSPLLIPIGCGIAIAGYIILVVISNHLGITDQQKGIKPPIRKKVTPLGVVIALFVIFGLLINLNTFVLTLVIEGVLAFAYLNYANIPGKKILYGILLANVFSQPLFVIALTSAPNSFMNVIVFEVSVWLAEAWIVNRVQESQLPFKNILILTFLLNAASFGIGYLLPL